MRLMNGAHFPPDVANLHAAPPILYRAEPPHENRVDISKSYLGQNRSHGHVSVSPFVEFLHCLSMKTALQE